MAKRAGLFYALMPKPEIVYDDNFIVVANKPSGVLTIPSPKNEKYTLTSLLNQMLKKGPSTPNLYPCHRLDRDTSGLIIYAYGKSIQKKMMEQFRQKKVKKKYIAFLQGFLAKNEGIINYKIDNQPALTKYKILQKRTSGFSVAEVEPITGKTNQIRLHFKMLGHPLIGERKFAFGKDFPLRFKRTALHAAQINFVHPLSKKTMYFKKEIPLDMKEFLLYN